MDKIKAGIIGYGGMGSWHAENIRSRIKDIDVFGIYDIKEEKRKAAQVAGFKSYNSVEKLYADVELIIIAVPNNYHKYYSIQAMKEGKSVVCEKPVCMNMAELKEILKVADETGMFFTVHHNRRWDIDFKIVKNVIDNNIIGKPYFIDSRLFGYKGLPGDWRSTYKAGGGMLYDWSIHLIDQMLCLVDSEVKSVYCQALKVTFKEVDDCNKILLEFKNGVRAQIVVDTWCYIPENRWHISADDGTLIMTDWLTAKGEMIKANREIDWNEGIIFTSTGRTRTMTPVPKEKMQKLALPQVKEPRWEEFYENVAACVRGEGSSVITHKQLIASMRVLDACFESYKNNIVVKL